MPDHDEVMTQADMQQARVLVPYASSNHRGERHRGEAGRWPVIFVEQNSVEGRKENEVSSELQSCDKQ